MPTYRKYAEVIDEYIKNEITTKELENTLETYDHIVSKLFESMGISDDISSMIKLEKLYHWITRIIGPQTKLEESKRLILGNQNG